MSRAPGPGDNERRSEVTISPFLLPDPPKSRRPRSRLVAVGAASLLVLAGASLFFTGQMEDGMTLRRAATGELEASGQPDL